MKKVAEAVEEKESKRSGPRIEQYLAGLVFLGIGVIVFWQLKQADFDWRAVLEGTSPWVFFLLMATLPVCGFPISVCYIYAGMAFEPWTAVAACWGALAINMSASFWLTRSVFREPLLRLLEKRSWKVPQLQGEAAWRVAFLLRTVPGPPFFFQNLVLGLSGMPFFTYLWVSILAQGSIAAGVIYCTGVLSRDPGSVGGFVAIGLIAILVVVKIGKWISKRRRVAEMN